MISKELLSEVLRETVKTIHIDEFFLRYHYEIIVGMDNHKAIKTDGKINIHELAHKCKEWAVLSHKENKEYIEEDFFYLNNIDSAFIGFSHVWQSLVGYRGKDKDGDWADLSKCFTADTEPEAIFKACEWIMEQKTTL